MKTKNDLSGLQFVLIRQMQYTGKYNISAVIVVGENIVRNYSVPII